MVISAADHAGRKDEKAMQYNSPVRIYEEKDAVCHHPEVFRDAGRRALVVTGAHSSKKNGSLGDLEHVLKSCGISFTVYDRVEENPSVDTVMQAAELGIRENVSFVIGVGGGSAMDAAKAAALLLAHRGITASMLYDSSAIPDPDHYPLILIPTTCGTGSEVTPVSVLTRPAEQKKGSIPYKIYAEAALIDGKYLEAAPMQVIRNTAVDALAHLFESAVNSSCTPESLATAEEGLLAWQRNRDLLLKGPECIGERERADLMHASMLAGMAIAQTGTSIPHALSYTVTMKCHIPHGLACGMFEAGYLSQAPEKDRTFVLQAAGFSSPEEFQSYFTELAGSIRVPQSVLDEAAAAVLGNPNKCRKAPFAISREVMEKIISYGGAQIR